MCGIFGYLHRYEIPNLSSINAARLLHHRGPDDNGWLVANPSTVEMGDGRLPNFSAKLLFIHTRLAILELSKLGWQPMVCSEQRYYLLFNGEIYNYLELRAALLQEGVQFVSGSDSEVLLKAFIHWGNNCFSRLVGMFALAIYDRLLHKITIARDAFGIKPFYYTPAQDQFIFASEIKALLPFLPNRQINPEALLQYLRSGLTDYNNDTMLEQVKQFPAGHYAELDLVTLTLNDPIVYWQPTIQEQTTLSFKESALELRHIFLENIGLHLRSDVTVAATLSGGIDSSAIVSSIRYLQPQTDIHTFSYIADDPTISEEKWVDLLNSRMATSSHKVTANQHILHQELDDLITQQDLPFGSSSIYAQHRVFQTASNQGIKVMLDGQGADEMLGGYVFYVVARFVSLLKNHQFYLALRFLRHVQHYVGNKTILKSLYYFLPHSMQNIARDMMKPYWIDQNWFRRHGVMMDNFNRRASKQFLHEELLHTLTTSSLPMLLRYNDRNSMSHSVESRVPFLTQKLVDFVFSLPEHFLIAADGTSKSVFREAMRGIVPAPILDRRDKIGFATPEKNWLNQLKPWVQTILQSDYAKSLSCFNQKQVMHDWEDMLQGKKTFDFRYWRWLNLIKWSELNQVTYD